MSMPTCNPTDDEIDDTDLSYLFEEAEQADEFRREAEAMFPPLPPREYDEAAVRRFLAEIPF